MASSDALPRLRTSAHPTFPPSCLPPLLASPQSFAADVKHSQNKAEATVHATVSTESCSQAACQRGTLPGRGEA